ncbi:IPTL-CTERM sorting domain-containing protein [Acidovorax sp. Root267]|uniref:IPTL-CTERM sorting domain-containing protein n=1 Tax=Acidovorax sp. Root267 TaxID=1736505 RepID=UPI001F5B2E54|nr:IPTL-CTERM sorting domain-containing protein [Acidovorax sp. Root267]
MTIHFRHWMAALALLLAAGWAHAQATIYSATSTSPYTSKSDFSLCGAGPCQNFTLTMGPSGSFTTSSPLPGGLISANIFPLITAFSLSDGINTYSSADPAVRVVQVLVTTDPSGVVVNTNIFIARWLTGTSPHVVNDRVSRIQIAGGIGSALHNIRCGAVAVAPSGVPDACTASFPDTSASGAGLAAVAWAAAPAPSPASIPTLSEWGLILMAGLLVLASLAALRRLGF